MIKLTVFTPTYNRANIIQNLYESLKRQKTSEFEWLVVDDGSSDNTSELFVQWMSEKNQFPIRYYKQCNSGKCQAINKGLDLAKGKLFFTVDSDDYLTDDALQKILIWEASLPKDKYYCGIAGNLGTSLDFTPNKLFKSNFIDGTALDRYKFIDGERAMVFYTEIHRKYKYPKFGEETFMTESVVWNRMAKDGYLIRYYNDIIWIYEYRSDGLTLSGNKLFTNNPHGYGLWLREKSEFMNEGLIARLKMVYTFTCDTVGKIKPDEISSCIGANVNLIRIFIVLHKIKGLFKG